MDFGELKFVSARHSVALQNLDQLFQAHLPCEKKGRWSLNFADGMHMLRLVGDGKWDGSKCVHISWPIFDTQQSIINNSSLGLIRYQIPPLRRQASTRKFTHLSQRSTQFISLDLPKKNGKTSNWIKHSQFDSPNMVSLCFFIRTMSSARRQLIGSAVEDLPEPSLWGSRLPLDMWLSIVSIYKIYIYNNINIYIYIIYMYNIYIYECWFICLYSLFISFDTLFTHRFLPFSQFQSSHLNDKAIAGTLVARDQRRPTSLLVGLWVKTLVPGWYPKRAG